jgi:hypothetical protein
LALERTKVELDRVRAELTAALSERDSARAECVELREALELVDGLAMEKPGSPPYFQMTLTQENMIKVVSVLNKYRSDYAGLAVVPQGELAELRRDGERLEWILKFIGANVAGLPLERVVKQDWSKAVGAMAAMRAAIDAAARSASANQGGLP